MILREHNAITINEAGVMRGKDEEKIEERKIITFGTFLFSVKAENYAGQLFLRKHKQR